MPNWKKLIVSGSDASLNSLNVTTNVTAQSFTGSFSGSFTAPGATTQVVYNNGGTLAASSNFVFSGSRVGIGTSTPTASLDIRGTQTASSGTGRTMFINSSLSASANSNTLVALDIDPSFNSGSFTSVNSIGLRLINNAPITNNGVGFSSPQLQLNGGLWNSASGGVRMAAGLQVMLYQGNTNPTISKLSFQVGSDNLAPTEKMFVTSNGLFGINGGANFTAGSGSFDNDITLTQTSGSNGNPGNSNRIVLKGLVHNSVTGTTPTMGFIQMINVIQNANPTTDKLSFFVGPASGTNSGNVVGNATERLALRTDGIFSYFNSAGTEFLRLVGATGNLLLGSTVDNGFKIQATATNTNSGSLFLGGTTVASGAIARTMFISSSLSASANSDVLVGLDINPTFITGSFTGTTSYAARIQSGTVVYNNTSPGIKMFNTVDQLTNTEYANIGWASNAFNILTVPTGTGSQRDLGLYSGLIGRGITIRRDGGPTGHIQFNAAGNSAVGSVSYNFSGMSISSGGQQYGLYFTPNVVQTGTGSYSMFYISTYESTVGTGAKNLIDVGTNSATGGTGTHTTKFAVQSDGFTNLVGRISSSIVPANNPSASLMLIGGTTTQNSTLSGSSVVLVNTVMSASANNQTLVGLDIQPTFTTGSFTGTTSAALRVGGAIIPSVNGAFDLGTPSSSFNRLRGFSVISPNTLELYRDGGTKGFQLSATTGNIIIQNGGTFTDAGFRLDVSGSTRLNGNTTITGSLIVSNGITGSLSGSATNAVSASYALSSSYVLTSSYAVSASYAVTSSYALTASYVNPLNQDLIITGSIIVTGGVTASNALITGNLSVLGTASFVYTTASVVTIGGNLITLNTDNPSVRFAGITVVDSGSFGNSSTGSLFWDSQNNRWIYSNPSGSSYDGGMFISGPRNTSGLGNEQGTTLNAILKGQGGDHLTSSGMFEDSSGNVGVGTSSPSAKFEVIGNIKATSFTGSFSGSVSAPGSTTQIVYNSGGALAADSGLVYSGSNVGIGISAPTDKLHIVSSATGNQFGRITATDSAASAAWVAQNDSGDNVVYRVFGSGVGGTQMGAALGRSASLLANLGGSGVFLLGTFSNTDFILGTNNTENMRIKSGGNVGIGTTSPNVTLEANGIIRSDRVGVASQYVQINGGDAAGPFITAAGAAKVLTIQNNSTTSSDIYFDQAVASTYQFKQASVTKMILDASGNVGIGTSSPSQKLEVSGGDALIRTAYIGNISAFGTDYASFSHIARTGSGDYSFLSDNSGITYINAKASNSIKFRIDNIDKAIIDSSGNVGIGTTTPSNNLQVVGGVTATSFTGSFSGSFTAPGATTQITYNNGGTLAADSGLVYSGSRVGIGSVLTEPYALPDRLRVRGGAIQVMGEDVANTRYRTLISSPLDFRHFYMDVSANTANQVITYFGKNVNGTETDFMTIFDGNIGIGTTSPSYKLQVNGDGNGLYVIGANSSPYTQTIASFVYGGNSNSINIENQGGKASFQARDSSNNAMNLHLNPVGGNVGIGTTGPGYKLEVVGAVSASTYYGDGSNLTNIGSGSVAAAGSDGQLQYNNGGSFGGASRLYYNDSTNRVGIGTSSPGYDLDVSGSARVQDRLRVGVVNTGNGVIHQSSDATINPTSATIVWSVPGSAGICAFIEYYVFNSNTGTSQRAGNIVTTWNASGTPQITHTETSTPDIGSTSPITFSTSLTLGGDPQLIATNSGGDIWYMIMNYRYF
jgi:hypothetical protein